MSDDLAWVSQGIRKRMFIYDPVKEEYLPQHKSVDNVSKELEEIKNGCDENEVAFYIDVHEYKLVRKDKQAENNRTKEVIAQITHF